MARLGKPTVDTTTPPKKETSLDKTTRVVKEMQDGESKQRHIKKTRLRKDRLEKEADAPVETTKTGKARKKPSAKADTELPHLSGPV